MARRILLEMLLWAGYFIFLCVLMNLIPVLFGEVSNVGWAVIYAVAGLSFTALVIIVMFPRAPRWVKQVAQTGINASAEILANEYLSFTGRRTGSDYWVKVPVRVHPNSDPAYEAQMACELSRAQLLAIGRRVAVKIDPQNPSQVLLINEPIS
jgi:hypothetical protein